MQSKSIDISIIIPTYNGAYRLPKLLTTLQGFLSNLHEIIVVVDGSVDNTQEVLINWKKAIPLVVILQENKGRAIARNAGAKVANGSILLFLDDDMLPGTDWLRCHIDFHKKYPHTILAGNQIEPLRNDDADFFKFRHYRRQKWNSQYGSELILEEKRNLFLTAANFSISKTTFDKLEGFDEELDDAEDFDLAMRAMEDDIPIYFDPNNIAWHEDRVNCVTTIRRMRQYRIAHEKLESLKPELYNKYNRFKITHPKGAKRVFFKLLANPNLPLLINEGKFNWLPRKLRYSFYEYVLASLGNYFPKAKVKEE